MNKKPAIGILTLIFSAALAGCCCYPLVGTGWTISFVDPPGTANPVEHVVVGDTLKMKSRGGNEVLVPGSDLAARWGLSPGQELVMTRTTWNRLCVKIDLFHESNGTSFPHIFKFKRFIDSDEKIKLQVNFDHAAVGEDCNSPDRIHNGVAHGTR